MEVIRQQNKARAGVSAGPFLQRGHGVQAFEVRTHAGIGGTEHEECRPAPPPMQHMPATVAPAGLIIKMQKKNRFRFQWGGQNQIFIRKRASQPG